MKQHMRIPLFFSAFFCFAFGLFLPSFSFASEQKITTSAVYQRAMKMEQEVHLIGKAIGVKPHTKPYRWVKMKPRPRDVWEVTYVIMRKINFLRLQQGLESGAIGTSYAVINTPPDMIYEQVERGLTELRLLKEQVGITAKTEKIPAVSGKKLLDLFNLLLSTSKDLDVLTENGVNPSNVFGEAMRIYEDVSEVLRRLQINDTAIPPEKQEKIQPKDAYKAVEQLLNTIQNLQREAGVERVDFSALKPPGTIYPTDVYHLLCMAIVEFKTIKAYLGMNKSLTPPAGRYEGKVPADVLQLIQWVTVRMQQIHSLNTLR